MRGFGKFMLGVFLGGVVSSTLVLLFTPVSGGKMRTRIKDCVHTVRNEVKNAAQMRSEELKAELSKLQNK